MSKKKTAREVVHSGWEFNTDERGGMTSEAITAAAMVDAAQTLRAILNAINSLGADGLHFVIREHAKKLRRDEKERREQRKARRSLRVAR